jgi:DNA-directed RNA polymerase subunit N (RpoN/RPB10)
VVKRAVSQSVDVLTNPFLATALFLCGRFIAITWHDEQEHSDRDDIDLILLLVDRIGEVWEPLAKKFRKAILRDLMMDRDEARRMLVGTGCYSSVECA